MSTQWRPGNANELGGTRARSAGGGVLALAVILATGVAGISAGQDCTFTFSPPTFSVPAVGGNSLEVQVTTQSGCVWRARTSDSWISFQGNSSQQGSGTLRFDVGVNIGGPRTGTVIVGASSLQVQQNGTSTCTFKLDTKATAKAEGGNIEPAIVVMTQPDCQWRVVSPVEWIRVSSRDTFVGSGYVQLVATANNTPASRDAYVTVAGQEVWVHQPTACRTSLTPDTLDAPANPGAPLSIQVGIGSTCSYEVVANDRWLSVSPTGPQVGPRTLAVTVEANRGSTRQGTLTVAGITAKVTQAAGQACTFTVPPSITVPQLASHQSMQVQTQPDCLWQASTNDQWITLTSGKRGKGAGPIGFDVATNPTTTARNGSITVADQTVVIVQNALPPCPVTLSPPVLSLDVQAATPSLSVGAATDCQWTATSNVSWITIGGGFSGTGPRTLQLNVAANTQSVARTGVITANGSHATVNQAAVTLCAVFVSPPTVTLPGTGGEATFTVSSQCAWTAQSGTTWLTVRSGASGAGNGQVVVSAGQGIAGQSRTAKLTIGNRNITVTQAAFTGPTVSGTTPQASPSPGVQIKRTPGASAQPRPTPTPRPRPRR